jgi:hypothetical protein
VRQLAAVLRGEYDRSAIERFVERFVRPLGIDVEVAPIVASTVLDTITARKPVAV